jgi:hypothetical protein
MAMILDGRIWQPRGSDELEAELEDLMRRRDRGELTDEQLLAEQRRLAQRADIARRRAGRNWGQE